MVASRHTNQDGSSAAAGQTCSTCLFFYRITRLFLMINEYSSEGERRGRKSCDLCLFKHYFFCFPPLLPFADKISAAVSSALTVRSGCRNNSGTRNKKRIQDTRYYLTGAARLSFSVSGLLLDRGKGTVKVYGGGGRLADGVSPL